MAAFIDVNDIFDSGLPYVHGDLKMTLFFFYVLSVLSTTTCPL